MKRMIMVCLAALLSLPACGEADGPSSPGSEFDANLIGYWYRVELPGPWSVRPGYHHAFYISPEGTYQAVAVETATGTLALLPKNTHVRLYFANAGRIGLDWFSPPAGREDTLDYQVDWNVLSVSGFSPISGVWTRKTLGDRVTDPVHSEFSCRIDDVETIIPAVAAKVGAWATLKPSFMLTATLASQYSSRSVSILLPDFAGPGTYSLANRNAQYNILDGDAITSFLTDAVHSGTITIDSFDASNKRCTGSFEFTVRAIDGSNNPPELVHFTNGRFSVPTYP